MLMRLSERIGHDRAIVRALRPLHTRWLRARYTHNGMPWEVNGEPLRIEPDSRHLVPRRSEVPLFQFLRQGIRPGAVVLDIGSFLGVYAMMAARWAGPSGSVVAFEPSLASHAILLRHLRMNGLEARVDARRVAVGARSGRTHLVVFEDEPYRNMIAPVDPGASALEIDVVTVDQVCASMARRPTWIRMDVQGLEFDVLRGARDLLRDARGRLTIVAEMHPEQWTALGIRVGDVDDILEDMGLRARCLPGQHDRYEQSSHAILDFV
jgi:FkbM family methyltransferase